MRLRACAIGLLLAACSTAEVESPAAGDRTPAGDGATGGDFAAGDPAQTGDTVGDPDPTGDPWQGWGDPELSNAIALLVPPGTVFCADSAVSNVNPTSAIKDKAQVTLAPGTHLLPLDQPSFALELIQLLAVGPGGVVTAPASTGTVTRTIAGTASDGTYTFEYTQGFSDGTTTWTFTLRYIIDVVGGQPEEETAYLGDPIQTEGSVLMNATTGALPLYHFVSCAPGTSFCPTTAYTFDNGDVLQVEVCSWCPIDWICKANMSRMLRARFTRGGVDRFTDDFFLLAHSWRHHNWGQDMVVWLPAPLDGISGIYLGNQVFPGDYTAWDDAVFYDAALVAVEVHTVTDVGPGSSW